MISKAGINFFSIVLSCLLTVSLSAQIVTKGKITYERRTNLYKQFDDDRMKKFIKEENKIKIDKFALYFNDSISNYSYIVPEEEDQMAWATWKNSVYTNLNQGTRSVFMDMFGTSLTLRDSVVERDWIITSGTRKIAGYECTRAIWQKNDSTRIYAWFTTDIVPALGPESVRGLPGAILGLATENGGIVYFASSVEIIDPTEAQLAEPKKKGKEYTEKQLYDEMVEKLKGQPFGDRVIQGMFFW